MRPKGISTSGNRYKGMSSTRTLPAISEDDDNFAPPIPPKARHRPLVSTYLWGVQLKERTALHYNFVPTSLAQGGEARKVKDGFVRSSKQIQNRGGWKRLWLLTLVLVFCISGLTVGIVVGLRNRNNLNGATGVSSSGSGMSMPTFNTTFPAGYFVVETYLEGITTSCTSNPSTWRCYPYITYAESPNSSAATFNWIIQPKSQGSSTYTVSSTNNPFSLVFANTTLTLLDANLDTERYTFQIVINKLVIPTTAITGSNLATACYYNSTTLEANLYTKMAKSYTSNRTDKGSSATPGPWPYAAKVEQIAMSGPDVPYCVNAQYDHVGDLTMWNGQRCSCVYQNYGA